MTDVDIRKLAVEKFELYIPSLSSDQIKDIETGIYNWTIDYAHKHNFSPVWKNEVFIKMYDNKLVSILSNLDENSYIKNPDLLKRLHNKEFKPHELSFMHPYEMCPERWIGIINKQLKKEKGLLDSNEAKTDMFKCGKCKKRQCSYYEMQVRSADESSTIFITCLNCKNKWRIG